MPIDHSTRARANLIREIDYDSQLFGKLRSVKEICGDCINAGEVYCNFMAFFYYRCQKKGKKNGEATAEAAILHSHCLVIGRLTVIIRANLV